MKFHHDDITIDIPDEVYFPREDTLMMSKVLDEQDLAGKRVLEMGCGSGLLSIVAAKKGAFITAADTDMEAIKITSKNAMDNKAMIRIIHSDLFENVSGRFDLIFFNPPYLPSDEHTHVTYSGGPTGREVINRFIKSAKPFLNSKGRILLLISSLTGEAEVASLFEESGFSLQVVARKKIPWEELMVMEARPD